jgi:hypothetical protein
MDVSKGDTVMLNMPVLKLKLKIKISHLEGNQCPGHCPVITGAYYHKEHETHGKTT